MGAGLFAMAAPLRDHELAFDSLVKPLPKQVSLRPMGHLRIKN